MSYENGMFVIEFFISLNDLHIIAYILYTLFLETYINYT